MGERAPLLEQEGWREAPGWSFTRNRPRLTTPAAPLAQRPLLSPEGNSLADTFCW
jgi:hypothetical protein